MPEALSEDGVLQNTILGDFVSEDSFLQDSLTEPVSNHIVLQNSRIQNDNLRALQDNLLEGCVPETV